MDIVKDNPSGDEKVPAKGKGKLGKLGKYKGQIIGALAAIAVLVFYFVRKNTAASTATTSTTTGDASTTPSASTDAGTGGYYYGGGDDGGYGSGSTRATGATGATRATGAPGPTGPSGTSSLTSPGDYYQAAVNLLHIQGIANPTVAEINNLRNQLRIQAGLKPFKNAPGVKQTTKPVSGSPVSPKTPKSGVTAKTKATPQVAASTARAGVTAGNTRIKMAGQ